MIVEQRTYTMLPGRVGDFLHLYQARGMNVQKRILGRMIGYFTSEFGELNQVVHLWGYTDLTDRAARRSQLFADPEWLDYFEQVLPLLVRQECVILTPTSFSPIGGADEG